MKQLLLTFLLAKILLLISTHTYAQTTISGYVKTLENENLPFANVLLLSKQDSLLLKGSITEDDGSFVVKTKEGEFILEVSMIGYSPVQREIRVSGEGVVDLGSIKLAENATLIDGVLVSAKKVLFEKKVDRTIINVQANSINRGNTVLNVLRSSPGVLVGQDDIAMSGKQGVRVMINGKLMRMPMNGVMQVLEGMNASNVESIQLISNPGAQYEAEGNAGFIDIILKESPDLGTITNIGVGVGMNLGINTNARANIQYRNKNLSINASYVFDYNKNRHQWDVFQSNFENAFTSYTDSRTRRGSEILSHNLNAGLNYRITPKTEFTFLLTGIQNLNRQNDINNTDLVISQDSSLLLNSEILEPNNWLNGSLSFGLIHKASDKSTLKLFYDNLSYYNRQSANYNLLAQSIGNGQDFSTSLETKKTTPINFHVLSSDYTISINAHTAFSMGGRLALSTFENQVTFDQNGFDIYDLSGIQEQIYLNENIGAGYAQMQFKASSKLSFETGLRYEHTITDIENSLRENVVKRNYGNWFPTAKVTYKISDRLSYELVYNRRITRPKFDDLAPFVFFQNPSTLVQGNSQLLPAVMDAIDFSINRGKYWITLQYANTKNFIMFFTPELDEMNNTIYSTQNLDKMRMLGISFNNSIVINSWWNSNNSISFFNYNIEDVLGTREINRSFNNIVIQSNQGIQLAKTLSGNLSLTYDHNGFVGLIDYLPQWMCNLGISKNFKGGSNLSLRVTDLFSSYVWKGDLELGGVRQSFTFDQNLRALDLTWSMPLGNRKLKQVNIENGSKQERARVN